MRKQRALPGILASLGLFAAAALLLGYGVRDASRAADAEGLRIARESVRRAAVSCYAAEGRYPESYAYLRAHYGVRVDEQKYAVHYQVFAENLMPEIDVSEREEGR